MKTPKFITIIAAALLAITLTQKTNGQTTEVTYQGQLQNLSAPANGNFDFEFLLFDTSAGGSQIGSTIARNGVPVAAGIFSVNLDFGSSFPGANRFLEIHVRQAGGGAFTILTPRQSVTSSPYSVKSLAADSALNATNSVNATNATNATNAVNATNLTGPLAGDVTGTQGATTVARLQNRNVASTAPLNGQVLKYNTTNSRWEPDTDNVSGSGGNGTITGVTPGTGLTGGGATGNVTVGIANGGVGTPQLADLSVTDAKINSVNGSKVTGAVANATNAVNATTATSAATATTAINATNAVNATNAANAINATNAANAVNFTGPLAGDVTGNQATTSVTKLRNVALPAPVVADNGKVLKYKNNGVDPITYEWATDITGGGSGVTSVTASGPLASNGGTTPNISLSGIVSAANGGTGVGSSGSSGNLLRSNGTAWVSSPLQSADIPTGSGSYIQNSSTQQATSNFNVSGNGTAGGTLSGNAVNSATQYNIGGSGVLSVAGTENLFAGVGAGSSNTTGVGNSFFGRSSGSSNTTGFSNSFFGRLAGQANTTGSSNSFFGTGAGNFNTLGVSNSFFGAGAGFSNTTANGNSFFGQNAGNFNSVGASNSFFGGDTGLGNTTGSGNSFFGHSAGLGNTTGNQNAFFGQFAGASNTTGTSNTFLGRSAGQSNTTGGNNVIIGEDADVGFGNLTRATAIGAGALVSTSNTLVLGTSLDTVQVPGNFNVTGTFSGNINGAGITNLNASNIAAGTLNNARLGVVPVVNGGTGSATQNFVDLTTTQTIAGSKTFSGTLTGNIVNATTQYNIGGGIRILSNPGLDNLFAGVGAGAVNTTGLFTSFFGHSAGLSNTTGFFNSFFGHSSGRANTFGSGNSFFGRSAGFANTVGSANSFFGNEAGQTNTTGGGNTAIGNLADVGASNLSNATAIGANAYVTQNDSVVIGSINGTNGATATASVGINTTAPKTRLHIVGNLFIENNPNSLILQSPNNSCFKITVTNAGVLSATAIACP